GDVARRGLAAQPFGEVARVAARAVGERLRGRRALGERPVEAEPVADRHPTRRARGAEVVDHAPEELQHLVVLHRGFSFSRGHGTRLRTRGGTALACAVAALTAGMLCRGAGGNGRTGRAGGGARAVAPGRRRRRRRGARAQAPGRARAARARRTPPARPCTPTSRGCGQASARRPPGCRPATTATASTSTSTSRWPVGCSPA